MTWTNTTRGRALDLLAPVPDDVDLDEIALSLGHQCRYAGGVRRFYSVAEHCVLISRWLLTQGYSPECALGGLLHDAAEAYTGDITWPMQAVLWGASPEAKAAYRAVQSWLDAIIAAKVGLPVEMLHTHAVRQADLRILLDERAALLRPAPRTWGVEEMGLAPLGVTITGWEPHVATAYWLDDLRRLQAGVRT